MTHLEKPVRLAVLVGLAATTLWTGCNSSGPVQPPAGLHYANNPAVYSAGTAIAPNGPISSGGAVASYSVVPQMPAGLTLDPITGVVTGTPAAVSAATTYTVTASNAAGSVQVLLSINVLMGWRQLAVLIDEVPVTAPSTTLSYTAVGSGPFTRQIKAKLFQSGGVTSATQAYINYTVRFSDLQ